VIRRHCFCSTSSQKNERANLTKAEWVEDKDVAVRVTTVDVPVIDVRASYVRGEIRIPSRYA